MKLRFRMLADFFHLRVQVCRGFLRDDVTIHSKINYWIDILILISDGGSVTPCVGSSFGALSLGS